MPYPNFFSEETYKNGHFQVPQSFGHFECATKFSVQGMKDSNSTHQALYLLIKGCPKGTKFLEHLGWVDIVKQIPENI